MTLHIGAGQGFATLCGLYLVPGPLSLGWPGDPKPEPACRKCRELALKRGQS